MKINIYGIGRSGTKALQLYLSYIFASNEKDIYLNYEPYNFCSRSGGPTNFQGLYYHNNSPHLAETSTLFDNNHQKFINNLKHNDNTVITKFVRGTGRMKAIDELMKPDLSILIVRDLYSVLESLAKTKWDFIELGHIMLRNSYYSIWPKFIKELENHNEFEWLLSNELIRNSHDRVIQNAVYWYACNLWAIKNSDPNKTVIINYTDFNRLPVILEKHIPYELNMDITDQIFKGTLIHNNNYPLKSKTRFTPSIINKSKQKINEFYYYLFRFKRKAPYNFDIGNLVTLSQDDYKIDIGKLEEGSNTRYKLNENNYIEKMNDEILSLVSNFHQ